MKRILVVGNGFDMDANLRTSYKDFVSTCVFIRDAQQNGSTLQAMHTYIETYRASQKDTKDFEKSTLRSLSRYFSPKRNNENDLRVEERERIIEICNQNFWLDFVIKNGDSLGDRWSDFEYIISRFITVLANNRMIFNKILYLSGRDEIESKSNADQYWMEINALYDFVELAIENKKVEDNHLLFENIKKELSQELDRLTWLLERYLCRFLNDRRATNDIIAAINADYVVSFNYTDTYQKLYDKSIPVHYIHGKVEENRSMETNNMVFGIEKDIADIADTDYTFLEFQKYYQRIVKKTGSTYKKWLEEKTAIYVFFFGHSLDYNDGDVIRDLIANKGSQSVIFYHDDSAFKNLVSNLIKIFGKEDIITYTGEGKIRFFKTDDNQEIAEYLSHLNDNRYRIDRSTKVKETAK